MSLRKSLEPLQPIKYSVSLASSVFPDCRFLFPQDRELSHLSHFAIVYIARFHVTRNDTSLHHRVEKVISEFFDALHPLSPPRASSLLSSSSSCSAILGIQTGREEKRERERETEEERVPRDYQRGGADGAKEQRQRSSRQINLRRDLRSGTSLSAYVCTRSRTCRPRMCVSGIYGSGLSSIARFPRVRRT